MIGLSLAGCSSSDTPQATAQAKKQFAGGPMPPDAQKEFQESMAKSRQLAQERAQSSSKH